MHAAGSLELQVPFLDPAAGTVGYETREVPIWREEVGDAPALDFVRVGPGVFWMGTPPSEVPRVAKALDAYVPAPRIDAWIARQMPRHRVEVAAFYLGRAQVTQAQWAFVAQLPRVARDLPVDPFSWTRDDAMPVDTVTWEEAGEFTARLSAFGGLPYRLPSEAEWEYACRAATETEFAFGDALTATLANYDGSLPYPGPIREPFRGHPLPTTRLGVANPWGLIDMHGNLWDWCQDTWHANFADSPGDARAWIGGGEETLRVVRGGSWASPGVACRSASRDRVSGHRGNRYVSFRVAVDASAGGTPVEPA